MHTSSATPSDEPAAMLRAFDAEERAELLDAVFDRLDREPASEAERASSEADAAIPLARRRPAARVMFVAFAAALAAALLVWLALRPPERRAEDAIATVPDYVVTQLRGGDAKVRSEPSQPPSSVEIASGATIDWIFTPKSPARGPIGVAVLVRPEAGAPTLVRPRDASVSPEGVVRLRGPIDALGPSAPGRYTFDVLIGRADTLPSSVQEAAIDGTWSRSTIEVTISTSE